MPSLPIFPLGTVLLPGAPLPLQLFEPRYLTMLQELMALPEQSRVFGVVALRRGHEVGPEAALDLHEVGCAARVEAVAAVPSPGGPRYHILAVGTRRFRLEQIDPRAQTPYLTGRVTWLGEPEGPDGAAAALAVRVAAEHAAYRRVLGAEPVALPEDPGALAYRVADSTVLALAERQRVLAAPDTAARLRLVGHLLRRERTLVEQFRAVPQTPDLGGGGLN
ncbi:MAG TPA: LON peptidase substrate-binding domain-containing protein [Candidatus Lustribacter sp.]|nr:LON peptidase substrate-binding domain-containing protein [Candidatus Lustribacter sp.]